jgi:HEAT repeat protein
MSLFGWFGPNVDALKASHDVAALTDLARTGAKPQVRVDALLALAGIGDPASAEVLIRIAVAESKELLSLAFDGVKMSPKETDARRMVRDAAWTAIKRHPEGPVRMAELLSDPDLGDMLVSWFSGRSVMVPEAARPLVDAKDPLVFATLMVVSASSDSVAACRRCCEVFGRLKNPLAQTALYHAASDDSEELRQAAAEALEAMGLPAARPASAEGDAPAVALSDLAQACREELLRFLRTERTRDYEARTGAWWSANDLKLAVFKAMPDVAMEELMPAVRAAVDALVAEGAISGTDSGYRAT